MTYANTVDHDINGSAWKVGDFFKGRGDNSPNSPLAISHPTIFSVRKGKSY